MTDATETRSEEVRESGKRDDRLDLILDLLGSIGRRLGDMEERLQTFERIQDDVVQEIGVVRDDQRYQMLGGVEHLAEELRRRRAGLRVRAYAEGRPDLLPPGDESDHPSAPVRVREVG